jgi:hypothetical protein
MRKEEKEEEENTELKRTVFTIVIERSNVEPRFT